MTTITCPHCDKVIVTFNTDEQNALGLFGSLSIVRLINRKQYLESELNKVHKAFDVFMKKMDGVTND